MIIRRLVNLIWGVGAGCFICGFLKKKSRKKNHSYKQSSATSVKNNVLTKDSTNKNSTSYKNEEPNTSTISKETKKKTSETQHHQHKHNILGNIAPTQIQYLICIKHSTYTFYQTWRPISCTVPVRHDIVPAISSKLLT